MFTNEKKRKLSLLKTIIVGVVLLSLVATVVNLIIKDPSDEPVLEFLPGLVLGIFLLLYSFTRKGFLVLSSVILISLLSLLAYYFSFRWGSIIPTNWMLLVLTVIIGGILISSKFALLEEGKP